MSSPTPAPEAPLPALPGTSGGRTGMIGDAGWRLPAIVVTINAVLMIFTAVTTLRKFPNAGDEYASMIQAVLLSDFRLSADSPPGDLARFFDFNHVINDGRFYGKYPPGWPLLLAIGVTLGVPWLVNTVIGVATLLVLHRIARQHFSVEAANLTLLLLLANPFLVFHSASHFAHPSCLLMIALAYGFYFNWVENPTSRRDAILLGFCAGFAFLIRTFTTVALLFPLLVSFVPLLKKRGWPKSDLLQLAWASGSLGVCLAVFLGYNYLQTGNPFLQPFSKYSAKDRPWLPDDLPTYGRWVWDFVVLRIWELTTLWLPMCLPLAAASLFIRELRANPKVRILLWSVVCLLMGFSLYPSDGGVRYGPRYAYETLAALALLCGAVLALLPRLRIPVVAVIVVINVGSFVTTSVEVGEELKGKTELYETVRRQNLSNAVVFLKTGSGTAVTGDLTRNGPYFKGSVLYVKDLGEMNLTLIQEMVDRVPYEFVYDRERKVGRLTPIPVKGGR